jgi:hypothetical protein
MQKKGMFSGVRTWTIGWIYTKPAIIFKNTSCNEEFKRLKNIIAATKGLPLVNSAINCALGCYETESSSRNPVQTF